MVAEHFIVPEIAALTFGQAIFNLCGPDEAVLGAVLGVLPMTHGPQRTPED